MNTWVKTICFLMLAAMMPAWTACIDDDADEEGTIDLKAGEAVPDFSVVMDNGQTVTKESLRGKTSLIVFFHTGCKDCRRELPVIQQIYQDYGEKINMVCISRAEKKEDIRAYWTEQGFTLPYSAQPDRTVYYLFAKSSIPRVYVVDKDLIIRTVFTDNPLAEYEDIAGALEAEG